MTALPSVVGPSQLAQRSLSARLAALAELARIGRARPGQAGFPGTLIDDSEALLRTAGERLRLSANHTVVAIAGGTGSGKSALFNALSGASFSPTGVTRPTTRHVHACVWGVQGAAPLLDWLGVERRHRYARASALDSGEAALNGLLLLDLPDHDSVVMASMTAVDRLSKLADMFIWVLDPQKYADAAVHNRYLTPLAGHASVFAVVLNQTDLLTPDELADCEDDLRRLLDAEGLADTPLLAVSARTGAGLDEVRALLANTVSASRAAGERISADIDALIGGYTAYAAGQVAPADAPAVRPASAPEPAAAAPGTLEKPPWEIEDEARAIPQRPPWEAVTPDGSRPEASAAELAANVPGGPADGLTGAFAQAAGLSAVAEGVASAMELRAGGFVGWPLARLRRRGSPARSARGALTGGQAQQSEVDNAITAFADAVGGQLPEPWRTSLRNAARSRAAEIPSALAEAVSMAVPGRGKVPAWWRLVGAWQWLLTVLAAAGLAWAIAIGVAHGGQQKSTLLGDTSLIPWLVIMAVAMLLLGWLTASGCRNMVLLAADHEREQAEQAIQAAVATVARDLVLAPAGREIGTYERFRRELAIAQGAPGG